MQTDNQTHQIRVSTEMTRQFATIWNETTDPDTKEKKKLEKNRDEYKNDNSFE
jgi:hypothetical protein